MFSDKKWPEIKEYYKSTTNEDLKTKFSEHILSFSKEYDSLYITKDNCEDFEHTALKKLKKLISNEMLEVDAEKRAEIYHVVKTLKTIISEMNNDSHLYSKDNEKKTESKGHEENKKYLDPLDLPSEIKQDDSYLIPSGEAESLAQDSSLKLLI